MVDTLRTLLWVPGNNEEKIQDAFSAGADSIVLDLEDLVPIGEKAKARGLVVDVINNARNKSFKIGVRINSWNSEFGATDLKAIVKARPDFIRLPKCSTATEMQEVDKLISLLEQEHNVPLNSTKVIVSLETALGVLNALPIATATSRVIGLGLGVEDFTTDIRTVRSTKGLELELLYARSHMLLAARAAGVLAVDGAFLDISDQEGLVEEVKLIKQLGFDGKSIIHPCQVKPTHEVFAPSKEEVEFARKVVAAFEAAEKEGSFYVFVDGKLVDPPVLTKAERILERQVS
ncbi:MAG: CoA ester lyase [Bacillota bacterium]|nr:CoA ester lyase [Bacillota bacterium]